MNNFFKTQQKTFSDEITASFEKTPEKKRTNQVVEIASPGFLSLDGKLAATFEKPDCTSIGCVIGLDKLKEAMVDKANIEQVTSAYNFAIALGKIFRSTYHAGTASMQYQADGSRIFAQIDIQDLLTSFQEPEETFQQAVAKFEQLTDDDTEVIGGIPSLEIGVLQPGRGGERECYYYYNYYHYYYYYKSQINSHKLQPHRANLA
jgi:urate oxidase